MVRRTYRRRATFQGRSIRPPWAGPASPQPPAMRAWTSGRRRGGSALGGWRRGGRPDSTSAVARVTVATACSNAASVAGVGRVTPLTLRTYWRAAASISSVVAGGSRPRRVVMLRHMPPVLSRCSSLRAYRAAGTAEPGRPACPALSRPPRCNRRRWRADVEVGASGAQGDRGGGPAGSVGRARSDGRGAAQAATGPGPGGGVRGPRDGRGRLRSEEHTSELQSHSDLVCRLLLEKKKRHC